MPWRHSLTLPEGGAAGFNRLFLPLYPNMFPSVVPCPAGWTVSNNFDDRAVDRKH